MRLIIVLTTIISLSGCGNDYVTKSAISGDTMSKIETVVDAILNDDLSEQSSLAKDIVSGIGRDVFIDGASAVLGWRFKDPKNLVKMFPDEFESGDLTNYVAASFDDKMDDYLIPAAEDCWERLQPRR
jgi:hypothetical protein